MKIKFLTQFVDASKIKSSLQWIFLGLIFSFDCFAAHNNDIELSRRISAIEKTHVR